MYVLALLVYHKVSQERSIQQRPENQSYVLDLRQQYGYDTLL
jgi:hypothetical protein